jgi:hypothetical protein
VPPIDLVSGKLELGSAEGAAVRPYAADDEVENEH